MLYVFHVDVGRMMSFDMSVALTSVENLKATIERLQNIPAKNIVLLVSGGEVLLEKSQVSCYSAGTDTNPIYMFVIGDYGLPPSMPQTDNDFDLRDQVERAMELKTSIETIVTRTQLALRMHEHAREEFRLCDRLVHEQHLQQQGWSAVVANMEDLTQEFRLRFHYFCETFEQHLSQRPRHIELLRNFQTDLSMLSRIPILPGLLEFAKPFHVFDELLGNDETSSDSYSTQQESVLIAGTAAPNATTETSEACDTSSTSPHKKQKMGEHETTEVTEVQSKTSTDSMKTGSQGAINSGAMRRISLTLLQWITSKENHNALEKMCEAAQLSLRTFNEEAYEKIKMEVQNTIKIAEQDDVKEIKGLGERLCKLDEFKYKIKSMVQEQKEHSQGMNSNKNRACESNDPTIYADLCTSHRSQLFVMMQNHKKILEHRRCITKAKDELGSNLRMRLNRIICIENAMSHIDSRLLFYSKGLQRAECHLNIIEQIHQAPRIYVAAVTEVVRRKIFSEEFGKWASKLSDDFDAIHDEEISRREAFNASFEGHFLNILFPGMSDMPPVFANENPLAFDARLPKLTKSDIDQLSSHFPDLFPKIEFPNMLPVIKFFVSRSGEHQKERLEQLLKEEAAELILAAGAEKPPQNLRLTELQKGGATAVCDESETDTEIEFEKVPAASGTSSVIQEKQLEVTTLTRSTLTERLLMTSAETLTDDNGSATRDEVERLRKLLTTLSQHSLECIRVARSNLSTYSTDAAAYRDNLQSDIQALQDKCKELAIGYEEREQQLLQENHAKDIELENLRAQLQRRDEEIERLQSEVSELHTLRYKCDLLTKDMQEMQSTFNHEKETAVAMAREELIHEHKTEIESLRCRFKLMTSFERSPSDMSLEKIERPTSSVASEDHTLGGEMIELKQHEAIKAQLQAEKNQAVQEAIENERLCWQTKLKKKTEFVMGEVNLLKIIEEKDRNLELLRDREMDILKQNCMLQSKLESLTNQEANSWLREKVEFLIRDKERLEKELEILRHMEMEGSTIGPRSLTYEQNVVPRSKSSSSSHKYAVLQSLEKGDVVFTVWSTTYRQYIVVQDSQSLFFVHGECLPNLKLQLPKREVESPGANTDESPIPMPYYAVGIVVEKEYCQARKDENRYRVPRGSKFYRVKLAPFAIAQPTARTPRDRLESFTKSVSRSQSQCESQSDASTTATGAAILAASMSQLIQHPFVASSSPRPDDRDVIDSGTSPSITTTMKRHRSTGSKSEEDEPVQLLGEHARYISLSEEEESSVTNATAALQQQQQSVITEQPTASNKLNLDFLLITPQDPPAQSESVALTGIESPKEHKGQCDQQIDVAQIIDNTESESVACSDAAATIASAASTIPISFGTTSEDSDEYRSLEGKEDEATFSVFE